MSKRKPNNPQARLARNCRALLANSHVAVMNIDRPAHPDLVDQRLISLRDGKPIALSQVRMVADAFCDFAYPWTVYFAAMCRDQQGAQYIKAEEIALSSICRANQLTDVLEHFCRELRDGCNARHLVSSGWIANTSGVALDEARAYELFEKFGAWTHIEQSRGAA